MSFPYSVLQAARVVATDAKQGVSLVNTRVLWIPYQQQSPSAFPTWCFQVLRVEHKGVFISSSICQARPQVRKAYVQRKQQRPRVPHRGARFQLPDTSNFKGQSTLFDQEPLHALNWHVIYAFRYQDVNQRHSPPHKTRLLLRHAQPTLQHNARISSLKYNSRAFQPGKLSHLLRRPGGTFLQREQRAYENKTITDLFNDCNTDEYGWGANHPSSSTPPHLQGRPHALVPAHVPPLPHR